MEFEIKTNDRNFKFISIEHGSHASFKLVIWVGEKYVTDGKIAFPLRGAKMHVTEKGSYVIRRDDENVVYAYKIASGYRGRATLDAVSDCERVVEIKQYHSQTGSLGEDAIAFFNAKIHTPAVISCFRTGRRVEENESKVRLTADGGEEELINDSEVCKLLNEDEDDDLETKLMMKEGVL